MIVHCSGEFSLLVITSRPPVVDSLLFHEVVTMENVSCLLVCEFDYAKFANKCFPSPPNCVYDLATYDVLCAEIFHVVDVWKSRDILASVLEATTKQHG